jgi:hypothetical protein
MSLNQFGKQVEITTNEIAKTIDNQFGDWRRRRRRRRRRRNMSRWGHFGS